LFLLIVVAGLVAATATGAAAASTSPDSSIGIGAVFVPDPVQSLGDESLTDQKDADAAVPAAAYHDVTLTNLDGSDTSAGTTRPSSARPATPPTRLRIPSATRATKTSSSRSWPTTGSPRRRSTSRASASADPGGRIDNRPQAVRINQYGQDNSFATDHPKNELRFGKGGVDDAEDAEVILH
jgi:zinc metalloprotease ZmpB